MIRSRRLAAVSLTASGVCTVAACVGVPAHAATPTPSSQQVQVVARSDMAGGVGAHITVQVNGVRVGSAMIQSATTGRYVFNAGHPLGTTDVVQVTYDNDQVVAGQDRNLHLYAVNGAAPAANSYVTGDGVHHSVGAGSLVPWAGTVTFRNPRANPFGASVGATTAHAPIVAANGQTIDAVNITQGARVGGDVACVIVPAGVAHVTIRNSSLSGCGGGEGVLIENGAHDITVDNNQISDVASGVWANHASNPLTITHNSVTNIRGPFPRGQMVQLDNVTGNASTWIGYNTSDDRAGASNKHLTHVEDHLSLYMSQGSAAHPIVAACNKLAGGDSTSGSGIMLGDNGGAWQQARNNLLVATANTGIAVSGGQHMLIDHNRIANDGAAGSLTANVGYVANFTHGLPNPSDVHVTNNEGRATNWVSPNQAGKLGYDDGANGFWNPLHMDLSSDQFDDQQITAATAWAQPIPGC